MNACPQSRPVAGVSRPFSAWHARASALSRAGRLLRGLLLLLVGLSAVGCAAERRSDPPAVTAAAGFVLSWEAIPSLQVELPGLRDSSYRERTAVAHAVRDEVLPLLLAALRIAPAAAQTSIEPGGYQGKTGVSLQTSLDADRVGAERLAAALGYVLRQHSILVANAQDSTAEHFVVRVAFPAGVLDVALAHRFFIHAGAVDEGLLGGYRGAGDELWFINLRDAGGKPYSGLRDDAFARALDKAAGSFDGARVRIAGSARIDAWLVANDWQQAPDGAQYLMRLQAAASLVEALDSARRAHDRIVLDAAARYRWH